MSPALALAALPAGTVLYSFLSVLFGAPFSPSSLPATLLWACLLSSLTVVPSALILGADWLQWLRIFILFEPKSRSEVFLLCLSQGALLGAWLGAWPIPLDWDTPWQVWPRSCVYGVLLGAALGAMGHAVLNKAGKHV